MKVVYAGEEMPESFTKSIFLAGPTPRNKAEVESWRPEALKILKDKGYDGVVFVPELRVAKADHDYDTQVEWEEKYLNVADCIVFWVPRDISLDSKGYPKMAAFTTNVEWGAWCDTGKVVFGAPDDATKNSYLKFYANKYNVPTSDSLDGTLQNALTKIGDGALRSGGERYVPLAAWNLSSFQNWYQAQRNAGNRLEDARLLYTFRPGYKNFTFLYILKVNVYVASEDRYKSNEFVLSRPDISSVCLWYDTMGDSLFDITVVLVKEFRSPASTSDAFIRELPGGSAPSGDNPKQLAAEELYEETGFTIEPSRLKQHSPRQVAGTLSAHKAHLFSAEITSKELEWFLSQAGVVHGKEEDTERTFIEVYSVQELLENNMVDWSTLGMIFSTIAT